MGMAMHDDRRTLAVEIELQPGERLSLPSALIEKIGVGRWVVTIEPISDEPTRRGHGAFLNGYAAEDEGLYDDYPGR